MTRSRVARSLICVSVAALVLTSQAARGADGAQTAPRVAAAANLTGALTEIADRFAHDTGMRVELVFGSSGTLTRQIRDGAPFEVFLAADEAFPNQLAGAGLTRDAGVVYSIGRLALFSPTGSPLTVDERLDGLATLVKSGRVARFAIANPDVAPYGQAAVDVLRKRGLYDALKSRLVLGDSVAQAAQFATTGNAAGGILAYSLMLAPGFANRGTYALIPSSDHPPIRQRMVLLKRAGPAAARFYQYMQAERAREVLRKHGFGVL